MRTKAVGCQLSAVSFWVGCDNGGDIWSVDVGTGGVALASRRVEFRLPDDAQSVDVMPDGSRAVIVRGGGIYSDLVLVQGALR